MIPEPYREFQSSVGLAESVIYKTWLERLNSLDIKECPQDLAKTDIGDVVEFLKVERFVYGKKENNRDKLISVFHAVSSCNSSMLILIESDGRKVDFYFGIRAPFRNKRREAAEMLNKSLTGNFPGTALGMTSVRDTKAVIERMTRNVAHEGQPKQICTVTGIAGLRSKEENSEKLFVQGMEKLVDAMQGEKYTLLLIADPVLPDQIAQVKQGYENLYTELSPFAGHDLNFGESENESVSRSVTEGTTDSINQSVSDMLSYTHGTNSSENKGTSNDVDSSLLLFSYKHGWSRGTSSGTNDSDTKGRTTTEGASRATSRTEAETNSTGRGRSRNLQIKFENKQVKDLLEKINLHLKRLNASADTGMWNCSVYCLADDASTSKIVAGAYQSLLRGENSSVENGGVTQWKNNEKIIPWLEKMHHPQLRLTDEKAVTPSSFVSSAELTIHAGLPQTSVGGLPVASIAPFGREVVVHWESGGKNRGGEDREENGVRLGAIYHMGKAEKLPVILNRNSFASHTFVTGSTGSGKSNTVYQLLGELVRQDVRFLVVEPAKGEYKNVFGCNPNPDLKAEVYGTNPALSPLLRINPFRFPKQIHILEHLDRLVEIFNVCWPMYAAMPAVLKDAIEESYKEAGWDMEQSVNTLEQPLYPGFADVVVNIRRIIDSSEYSDENKGNYKGSLITRLKSLANGINGMIFTDDELTDAELFDRNVIVDLSRVGSMETKALIMGLLVMKLQEYRMTSGRMNADLRHVTVLEEAHNLLKRTSTEQSSDSANLLGKSVEMLANAIAEMRTYGEGFVIADQSPGLLDMSVIRNTNTKIVLCLPDQGDRELVGKSAGLNDDQIVELAKLQRGVAAVYQNDWLQPVLCKVDCFVTPQEGYMHTKPENTVDAADSLRDLKARLINFIFTSDEDVDDLKPRIIRAPFETWLKVRLYNYVSNHQYVDGSWQDKTDMIAGLFHRKSKAIEKYLADASYNEEWIAAFCEETAPYINNFSEDIQRIIRDSIIIESVKANKELIELRTRWFEL
jgi:hypothetical protein